MTRRERVIRELEEIDSSIFMETVIEALEPSQLRAVILHHLATETESGVKADVDALYDTLGLGEPSARELDEETARAYDRARL